MRLLMVGLVALLPLTAAAGGLEFEIKFRFQPDDTGKNTLNKSVELDRGELTIEESRNDGANRYVERTATAEEEALIEKMVRDRLAGFEFAAGNKVRAPKVEVEFEVDGESRKIEIEEKYPAGSVPADILAFQDRFFEDSFK